MLLFQIVICAVAMAAERIGMELKEKIRDMVERMLELEENELGYDSSFAEYDMDSFTAMQLVAMLESECDVIIPDDKIKELVSVDATVKIIEELQNG